MRRRSRRTAPDPDVGEWVAWPVAPRRSLNPFPPLGRAIRSAVLGIIHEDMLLMVVVGVAMVVSYSGIMAFAEARHLPHPWVWPVIVDVAAVAVNRVARKMERLRASATSTQLTALALVVLSVTLQISTVTLPPMPAGEQAWALLGWLWTVVPDVVAHGGPAVVAWWLSELVLKVKRAQRDAERRDREEAADARRAARAATRTAPQTPGNGQRRPTPSALESEERKDREGETVEPTATSSTAPPGPLSPEAMGALADQVDATLRDLDVAPTKQRVRSIIVESRGSCSSQLAQDVNRLLHQRRSTSASVPT